MVLLIILIYLVIGSFFMGVFPDTSGRPVGAMVVLWIVIIPILGLAWFLNLFYKIGEKINKKFKR